MGGKRKAEGRGGKEREESGGKRDGRPVGWVGVGEKRAAARGE